MRCSRALAAALAAGSAAAQETVLGVYIFSRHADRTAKAWPPTSLTDLGYEEAFTSGTYFRNRYVASGASYPIYGINTDLVKESQITASAPVDTVIQNSAQGFLQGLYPPVGQTLGSETLRNGTVVQSPLNGYQLIPLQSISAGANSENSAWLEGATNCANAQISSDDFFLQRVVPELAQQDARLLQQPVADDQPHLHGQPGVIQERLSNFRPSQRRLHPQQHR